MILAVQDSTEFNFAGRPALSGLGVLSDNQTAGFMAHTTLAVGVDGVPLGVLEQPPFRCGVRTIARHVRQQSRCG